MTAGVFAQKNAKEQSRILLALQREAYSNPAKVEELAQLREIYWHGYNEVIKEIENRR